MHRDFRMVVCPLSIQGTKSSFFVDMLMNI